MNSVNLIGRLVADPELRYTPNGAAVTNARIAVDQAGAFISEKEGYEAGFFSVVVWGKQAESFAEYCRKGREVAVSGRLQQRYWDTDDEERRYVTEVVANRIDFLREPQGEGEDSASDSKGSKDTKGNKGKGGNTRGKK